MALLVSTAKPVFKERRRDGRNLPCNRVQSNGSTSSDWLRPSETPVKGNVLCLYLSGGTRSETTALFHKLAEGAEVTDPLSDLPYGLYGALNDKFGMRWMFHSE
jgi:uncharacterized glyoxalase superfamily protein PhnB